MPRNLSPKQRKLIKARVSGKSWLEAAKEAGLQGTDEAIRLQAVRSLKTETAQTALEAAWRKAGLDLDALASEIKDGLKAKKYGPHDAYVKLAMLPYGGSLEQNNGEMGRPQLSILILNQRDSRGLNA